MNDVSIAYGDRTIETSTEAIALAAAAIGGNAQGKLRSLVERIERLEEDKAALASDLKEVYGEAKGEGFDARRSAGSDVAEVLGSVGIAAAERTPFRPQAEPGSRMAVWLERRARWRRAVDDWLEDGRPDKLVLEPGPEWPE